MAISRKHYTQVAETMACTLAKFRGYHPSEKIAVGTAKAFLGHMLIKLADIYQEDNRNFDRKKFYQACLKLSEYEVMMKDLDKVEF